MSDDAADDALVDADREVKRVLGDDWRAAAAPWPDAPGQWHAGARRGDREMADVVDASGAPLYTGRGPTRDEALRDFAARMRGMPSLGATTTHELKTWPEFFEAVRDGRKPFEVRRTDDRTFAAGDVLHLREYDPAVGVYTGRECSREVTYVLAGPPWLPEGLAVMGLRDLAARREVDAAQAHAYRLEREVETRTSEHMAAMGRANRWAFEEIARAALEERDAVLGWLAEIEADDAQDPEFDRSGVSVVERLRARLAERWPDATKGGDGR